MSQVIYAPTMDEILQTTARLLDEVTLVQDVVAELVHTNKRLAAERTEAELDRDAWKDCAEQLWPFLEKQDEDPSGELDGAKQCYEMLMRQAALKEARSWVEQNDEHEQDYKDAYEAGIAADRLAAGLAAIPNRISGDLNAVLSLKKIIRTLKDELEEEKQKSR